METPVRRLQVLAHHLSSSSTEVVICAALRTPLIKSVRGVFKDVPVMSLLQPVIQRIIATTRLDPSKIGDIVVGNVLPPGAGFMTARMTQMLAEVPYTVPLQTVNRLCSSGLHACDVVANEIMRGEIEVGLAAGVENMSQFNLAKSISLDPATIDPRIMGNQLAKDCMMPMGITSENVAEKYGITREMQDQMAVESHAKAARAQEMGLFDSEIIPMTVTITGKDGKETNVVVTKDDGIRKGTTLQTLAKLKPYFKKNGSTTAGNSSQLTDGAAGVLLASRAAAQKYGLPILARWVGFATAGVPPNLMGIGPAAAIPKVLQQCNLRMSDIDIFELNEAFASQAVYCVNALGIPKEKLNPKGGAIALGHPVGCTGARQIATLIPELKRTGKRFGVVSMCMGTGMGAAAIIENISG